MPAELEVDLPCPKEDKNRATPAVAGAIWSTFAWTVAVATGLLLVQYVAVAGPGASTIWFWAELVSNDVAAMLPFVAVAAGLRLARARANEVRAGAVAGLALAGAACLIAGVAAPLAEYAVFVHGDRYGTTLEMFGIQTPRGILRNLEYVRAHPPSEYSMSVERPDRAYPSRLELALHLPFVAAGLALLNTFVGLVLGGTTDGMRERTRRLTRWSVGLGGALATTAVIVLTQGPHRDWESASGIVAAWTPVLVPAAELAVLVALRRRQRAVAARPGTGLHGGG